MKYLPLYSSDHEEGESLQQNRYNGFMKWWREVVILILLASTVLLACHAVWRPMRSTHGIKDVPYRLTSSDERWVQYQWNDFPYSSSSSKDNGVVDAAWNEIVPAHGFVAVDHERAAAMNLPATMDLPSDHSKGVYIIDAYHQMHCITIIRRTLQELSRGETPHYPVEHSRHCFDSLRQYVMCGSPGDTLLYTWGRNQTGDGQVRKCRDWPSMRDWATKHTACYRDTEHGVPLSQHFGHCDNGTDGLQIRGW